MALLLQLVPVLSMLFLITTAAGSALWAAKIEKARKRVATGPEPEQAPPEYAEYADNPV